MANTWRDTFKPVNVAEEKDNLGQPIRPDASSWKDTFGVAEEVTEPKQEPVSSWRSTFGVAQEPVEEEAKSSWRDTFKAKEDVPGTSTGYEVFNSPFDKYEKGELTKEKALKDQGVLGLMREGLELRFGSRGAIRSAATYALGGAGGGYTNKMEDEDVFEMWQNWQRSFAGGQSVTTANEVAFNTTLNDDERATLGSQYLMFEKNPNIFSAEVSWGEMFDGMKDYATAAFWDPTTIVSFGVGKALSVGGTKTAAAALKTVAINTFKESIKQGLTKTAAKEAASKAVKTTYLKTSATELAKYSAVDFVANIGTDVLYQNQLIDTGAQEEFQASQTAIAALSTIMIPAVIASSKGFSAFARSNKAPEGMKAYVDVTDTFKDMSKDVINDTLKSRIDWDLVDSQFSETLENFSDNRNLYSKWSDAKVEAAKDFGEEISLDPTEKTFVRSFLFGDPDGKTNGFIQTMAEAGLVYVKRGEDDNVTNFIGDVISWMPDETVTKYVKTFTDEFGEVDVLKGVETAEQLSAFWKKRQSEVGSRLWDSKYSKVLLSNGITKDSTAGDILSALATEGNPEVPAKEVGKYVLSLYKSLLTSHPGTTGLNIKGWASTNAAGTLSDFVQGGLDIGLAPLKGALGGKEAYTQSVQRGRGSVSGALRRGVNFLMPGDTVEAAMQYMTYRPELLTKLSRDLGGDSGARAGVDTLKTFNLDPNSKLNLGLEGTRNFVQTVTGVKLQDEMTKMLSFQSNMDLAIRREYGVSFNTFMNDPKLGFVEMHSPRYREKVEADALDRTLRETFSKQWTSKPGSNLALTMARTMENVSSNPAGGYLIPFGKFFNTSIAMMSDYSGLNAIRILGGEAAGFRKNSGLSSEQGTQLVAKAVVGWVGVTLMSDEKLKNLAEGLRWNQKREDDGSLSDKTYDFPETMLHLVGQMIAHKRRDGEVPQDLAKEFIDITVGQTFRATSDATTTIANLGTALAKGDVSAVWNQAFEVALGSTARIASGATRSLEPANVAIKFAKGDFQEPDRNVSGDAWQDWSFTKKATRYVDEFFEVLGGGAESSPRAASPTAPNGQVPDMGKVMLGVRGTPGNSLSESMLNSIGKPSWKAFRWGNDADLKNYMNTHVSTIFDEETAIMFDEHPDFFELPIANREKYTEAVIASTKKRVTTFMESNGGGMKFLDRLTKVNKNDLRRAQEALGIEGNPKDLLTEEGGDAKLNLLLEFAENYDELSIN